MVKALNLTKPKNKMKKPLKKKRQRCIEASCFTNHKGKHEQFDIWKYFILHLSNSDLLVTFLF